MKKEYLLIWMLLLYACTDKQEATTITEDSSRISTVASNADMFVKQDTSDVSYIQNNRKEDNCLAVINWKYVDPISIYNKPTGKVIYKMQNDSTNEDLLDVSILDATETYFYVRIKRAIKKDDTTGWIKKANYIGAYKRNEKFPMDLILYKDAHISDVNKIVIHNWTPGFLTIEECVGTWTFVSANHEGRLFSGWIETNELCANSYSYCN